MNKAQRPECGLSHKSAVLVAIFFAIVSNLPAQENQPMSALIEPSPSPSPAAAVPVARDAQGNVVPTSGAAATAERVIVTGSNIPTAEEVGVNPVDIYNRESLSKSWRAREARRGPGARRGPAAGARPGRSAAM